MITDDLKLLQVDVYEQTNRSTLFLVRSLRSTQLTLSLTSLTTRLCSRHTKLTVPSRELYSVLFRCY